MISIIIPTCNRNDLLSDCLNQLAISVESLEENSYEIIVSDDSKNNLTHNLIHEKYSGVKWIEGPKKGPAANRNNGAKNAKGDWLIFIDDDCLPGKNLVKAYQKGMYLHTGVLIFEGLIDVDRAQKDFMEEAPINKAGGYLWSCNFMINKDFFLNVLEGFDEEYPYAAMEDVDLRYRIKMADKPVVFLKDAAVVHPWRLQKHPFTLSRQRFLSLIHFVNKFPERKKDYSITYFFKAFRRMIIELFSYSIKFNFRGFYKKLGVALLQLNYGLRVEWNGMHRKKINDKK